MMRTQFPLRLAYAFTVNKSQGQEFDRCLYDVRIPPFAHGHCYVAKSRVKDYRTIALYCDDNSMHHTAMPKLVNIVYPDVLEAVFN